MTDARDDVLSTAAIDLLREVAVRGEIAFRTESELEIALLGSIVDATAAIFAAEAASIALHDEGSDELRFVVAAGAQGAPVVGRSIPASQGIAGYVFTTGESLAVAQPEQDPRFGRDFAQQTGYVPRSILAVPLQQDSGTIGVLEVLDKREGTFSMRDLELASVFSRQAATAIQVARRARDIRLVMRTVLTHGASAERGQTADEIVSAATRDLAGDDRFWSFVDTIASLRHASASDHELALELLALVGRHARARSDPLDRFRRSER